MENKKPLWHEIIKFSKNKSKIAVGFIVLGLLGLVLPIIPGILLLLIGLFILKPEWYEKFKRRFGMRQEDWGKETK
jgi:uncharacterized membrane protein YbaN (DUF454 family)